MLSIFDLFYHLIHFLKISSQDSSKEQNTQKLNEMLGGKISTMNCLEIPLSSLLLFVFSFRRWEDRASAGTPPHFFNPEADVFSSCGQLSVPVCLGPWKERRLSQPCSGWLPGLPLTDGHQLCWNTSPPRASQFHFWRTQIVRKLFLK